MPAQSPDELEQLSLDELYRMTAYIYSEQNAGRAVESTFAHFVEVCGMLTRQDRNKPLAEINVADALCKALGWYFPLMAKFKVASLEELVFRKYPRVCPYCRVSPHDDLECKNVRGGDAHGVIQHGTLKALRVSNTPNRPVGIDEWQKMFQQIYPRTVNDQKGRSTLGLMEEVGELAEAIRVFDEYPEYFAGEAADVFSYMMGIANEHTLRMAREGQPAFSLETEFIRRYPGMCTACGYSVCRCPNVPEATVGRLAKELPLDKDEELFKGSSVASTEARAISERVLERIGGFQELIQQVPLDRGDANRAVVEMTLRLAETLKGDYSEFAESLQRNALKLMRSTTDAGERSHSHEAVETIRELNELLKKPEVSEQSDVAGFGDELRRKVAIKSDIDILFVSSAPIDRSTIRADVEARVIREAIDRAKFRERLSLEVLGASTVDTFRRAHLARKFDVLHFAGHGDPDGLLLEDDQGNATPWAYEDLRDYLARYGHIQCVVLNACYSAEVATYPLKALTVAVKELVDDPAAIEFSKGFYDALGAGKDFRFAIQEGEGNARAQGYRDFAVTLVESAASVEPEGRA